ncbi:hypothetical protein [Pectobacterium polaris]|uniref:hypothetical protein n=1 Tax=Pectobacterium polaris TaxID=2042057 RepID=UPI001F257DEC|nr:hypothetical protein [Pectobacterium polaris]
MHNNKMLGINGASFLEIRDWITLISAFIVATGWFVTGHLNRIKDISQKRLEYRLRTLEAFLPVWFSIQKNSAPFTDQNFLANLENARSNFQLYGLIDEIKIMEEFISAIEAKNLKNANEALFNLVTLVRSRIRKELKIKS